MSGFLLVQLKQVKKATVITWNSLKTRNSLSGEFWVLSYDFCRIHIFCDTSSHAGKTRWKLCFRLQSVKNVFEVLRFLK